MRSEQLIKPTSYGECITRLADVRKFQEKANPTTKPKLLELARKLAEVSKDVKKKEREERRIAGWDINEAMGPGLWRVEILDEEKARALVAGGKAPEILKNYFATGGKAPERPKDYLKEKKAKFSPRVVNLKEGKNTSQNALTNSLTLPPPRRTDKRDALRNQRRSNWDGQPPNSNVAASAPSRASSPPSSLASVSLAAPRPLLDEPRDDHYHRWQERLSQEPRLRIFIQHPNIHRPESLRECKHLQQWLGQRIRQVEDRARDLEWEGRHEEAQMKWRLANEQREDWLAVTDALLPFWEEIDNMVNQLPPPWHPEERRVARETRVVLDRAVNNERALVKYTEFFLDLQSQRRLREELEKLPFDKEHYTVSGVRKESPRTTISQGNKDLKYEYSGIVRETTPWTREVREVRDRVSRWCGADFNFVVINRYRNGRDSVSWHSDNEKDIVAGSTIASVSVGATRTFSIRPHTGKHGLTREDKRGLEVELDLLGGSLLTMEGQTQLLTQHRLKKGNSLEERFNLTFRQIVPRTQI